jgi:hypothetical protein
LNGEANNVRKRQNRAIITADIGRSAVLDSIRTEFSVRLEHGG